jgi:hypothetical protein
MVVPLIGTGSDCIVPFPASNATITIPFNNVAGACITAVAIANTTTSAQTVPIGERVRAILLNRCSQLQSKRQPV